MSTNSNSQKPRIPKRIIILGVVLLALAVVLFFALMGRSTVTGAFPASIKTGSSVCSKDKANYPYTDYEDKTKLEGTIRVVATFSESKAISKIALDFTTYFSDNKSAVSGEAFMHGALGRRFNDEGIVYDEFENKFSIIDKKVVLSLVADIADVNEKNYKYLLLSSDPKESLSLTEYKKNYEGKGFKCTTTGE